MVDSSFPGIPESPTHEAGDSIRGYLYQFLRCIDLLVAGTSNLQVVVEAFEDLVEIANAQYIFQRKRSGG